MRLPDFLVVGAMKAGTTTLKQILRCHPEVFMAPEEIHFFDDDDHFGRGLEWYARHFEAADGRRVAGEKTPTYSYLPVAAERIHAHLPDVRLVWMFRDPVRRAYSNYWHAVKRGHEPLSFAQAVEREAERVRRNLFHGYVQRSVYADQVERFLGLFPREQMYFIVFEQLVSDPAPVLGGLWRFLGIEDVAIERARRERANVTYIPASRWVEHMAWRAFGNRRPYRLVSRLNRKSAPGYPPMPEATREQLRAFFRPHNRRLGELTGLDTAVWER